MPTILHSCAVFDGTTLWPQGTVVVDAGKVRLFHPERLNRDLAATGFFEDVNVADTEQIDLSGYLLTPGFIDIQVNGGGGVMFDAERSVEGSAEGAIGNTSHTNTNNRADTPIESMAHILQTMARAHRRFGTTGMLPTLITTSSEHMRQAANAIATVRASEQLPEILGVHFEGPWLSPQRKGAHDPRHFRIPSKEDIHTVTRDDLGSVLVTLAPECVPTGTIKHLTAMGVKVCAGHTDATAEQIQLAINEGLRGFTHLYNAMSPLSHRAPGVVGAALTDSNTWCGLIVDGHHVSAMAMQVAVKAKTPGKMILVTDAMATVGAPHASFRIRGETVREVNGRCVLPDGTLAGAALNMAQAVRYASTMAGVSRTEALRMASRYPADFLGLGGEFGRIAPGYRADFALLDVNFEVVNTMVAGTWFTPFTPER